MSSHELFERRAALTALATLREEAFAGRGGVALVTGPVAVGKSALLDVFAGESVQAGGLALSTVAAQAESSLQLGVLSQFAHCAAMPAEDRARIRNLMAEAAREMPAFSVAHVADSLCTHLIELSGRIPLIIVVDDVQHADSASLAGLGFLARRVRAARITLVLSHGDHSAWPSHDFLMDVQRQPFCRTIALQPLSRAGVTAMLSERIGRERAADITEACFAASGGNPLLVHGLLEDIGDAQGPDIPIGDGYRRAVLAALRRSSPAVRAVAEAVAVLNGSGCVDRLLGRGTAQAATELVRAGLLDQGRFRHPAAASAVTAAMDAARRADLHQQAADMAYRDGRPAVETAAHLLAAGRATTPWAISALSDAARVALIEGRVTTAIDFLRLASEECEDEAQRAKLITALARAEWQMNPALPLPHLPELVEVFRAGRLVGADAAELARALLWHGNEGDAETVLKLAGAQPADPESLMELRATCQWLRFTHPPLYEALPPFDLPEPSTAATDARRRFDVATVLHKVLTDGPSEALVEQAERILLISGLGGVGIGGVESALLALIYAEQTHRAAPWCGKLIGETIARDAPARRARILAIRAEIALRDGLLASAEEHACTALTTLAAPGWGVAIGSCISTLATALAAMGRSAQAAEALRQPVPEAMLRSRFGLAFLRARGRVGLARADYEGALADFLCCGDLMRRWHLDSPSLAPWRTDAAECWLALGEPDRARALLEDQLARCECQVLPRAHGNALRLLAQCSQPHERLTLLAQAAGILRKAGDRYALALTLTDLTAALSELGEESRARITGRRARVVATECHAEPLLKLLTPYGGPPDTDLGADVVALSEAEQRVAELAARGLTNREIAQRLFITVSTVEQHLTRVYRKLGVTRRSDLAAAQADQEADW